MKKLLLTITLCAAVMATGYAQEVELLPYGDLNNWVTRNIKESRMIGGKEKQCYAIGPTSVINGDKPYTSKSSPWATSNVMAKVCGITKVSNAVFPDERCNGNKCAKLTTMMEECKAAGIINVKVLVTGTMFLGKMLEPVKSTSDPYSKMEMGVPFTKHPRALRFDYKLEIPDANMIYSSGFGKQRTINAHDKSEAIILLQRRWEDADGNIYAKRVGTGRELIGKNSNGWVNKHMVPVQYGQPKAGTCTMNLIAEKDSYYARNSKGKMVPVKEVGWDDADATPTHIIVMFSAGSGGPYTGTVGTNFWVDNIALAY